jgi:hypothetical protein
VRTFEWDKVMTKVEREVAARMNDSTEITIPLRNLVSMIAAASIATWAYFGLTERISFLEHNLDLTMQEVEENDDWIDNFELPQTVQDTVKRVHQLELEIARLKLLLGDK